MKGESFYLLDVFGSAKKSNIQSQQVLIMKR